MDGTKRRIKMGLNATVLTIAVGGILVLAYIISLRYPQQYDVTKNKTNTLAAETQLLMKTLNDKKVPVMATVFFPGQSVEERHVKDLYQQLSQRSDFFQYEFVDPLTRPAVFRQMGMSDYGVIVSTGRPGTPEFRRKILNRSDLFQYDPMTGEESFIGEQATLNAVVAVALKKDAMVCFIEGQGEYSITSVKPDGLSKLADLMEAEAYSINVARLSGGKPIPEDCKVAIMAGPKRPVISEDRNTLQDFLDRGGALLVLLDAGVPMDGGIVAPSHSIVPGVNDMLSAWGLSVSRNFVADRSRSVEIDGLYFRPLALPGHPVTETIEQQENTMKFAFSLALDQEDSPPDGVTITPLLKTSPGAVECEFDFLGDSNVLVPQCGKQGQEYLLAVAVDVARGDKPERIVVAADSLFATNAFLRTAVLMEDYQEVDRVSASEDNAGFVLNSVNWLAGQEDVIALRPRPAQDNTLKDTYDFTRRAVVFKLFTFVIPLGILIIGGLIWHWRRTL